jgi:hypothetical protein
MATDKKFRELQRDWNRRSIHTAFRGRGQHLVQLIRRGIKTVIRTDNRRQQAPWVPNVKGMRWQRGQLIPRHST